MEPEVLAYIRETRPDLLEQLLGLMRPPVSYEQLRARHDLLYSACEKMLEAWDCRTPAAGIVAIQDALFGTPTHPEGQP